jgi:hypothetical protein
MIRNRKELRSASATQSVFAGRRQNEYMVEDVVKLERNSFLALWQILTWWRTKSLQGK